MRVQIIVASLAAGSALGQDVAHAPVTKPARTQHLQARQTDSNIDLGILDILDVSEECTRAVMDILPQLPQPDEEVLANEQASPYFGDPCIKSTPASLSSEYAEWTKTSESWIQAHTSEVSAFEEACPSLTDLVKVCSESNEASSDDEDNEDAEDGAAPRQTGIAIGALAVGLVAGLAVVL